MTAKHVRRLQNEAAVREKEVTQLQEQVALKDHTIQDQTEKIDQLRVQILQVQRLLSTKERQARRSAEARFIQGEASKKSAANAEMDVGMENAHAECMENQKEV